MLPFKLVYHPGYYLPLGDHVFPAEKYRLIHQHLLATGIAEETDFLEPEPASDEDMMLAHEEGWVRRLRGGTLSMLEVLRLEIPYSRPLVEAFWLTGGGSILAARRALEDGVGFNIGGGFHHGFRAHGEGFCAINDVAVAIRRLEADGAIRTALVIDCDVHQGNGTASIFADDDSVFTISLHQYHNYPAEKPPSDIDVHLADETADEEYLAKLAEYYVPAVRDRRPGLVLYVAGADPYVYDRLGGLSLSMEGLRRRDELVIGAALEAGCPCAVTLAGGYAELVTDTVLIHVGTVQAAAAALGRFPFQDPAH